MFIAEGVRSTQTDLITHRPLSSSFLGLRYRILNINHKKELLRGLWVGLRGWSAGSPKRNEGRPCKAPDEDLKALCMPAQIKSDTGGANLHKKKQYIRAINATP